MTEDIRYNVSELFQLAFGINSPVYITEHLLRDAPATINYGNIQVLTDYAAKYSENKNGKIPTSWMTTPIMFSATFKGGQYWQYNMNGELMPVTLSDYTLPPATMFEFRRAKNITRTNVLGNNGTIKEIFGFDDWVIDVSGLCLDEPTRSAQSQFEELLKWENLASAIEVTGSQFSSRNLKCVCINDWSENIPQGQPGVVAFQMQLIGDDPMEFSLPNFEGI